jgi:hypothetical protein
LGSYRLCPFPSLKVKRREILPQASAPFQSVTNATPQALRRSLSHLRGGRLRLPRFRPLQRLASHGEPLNPASSHLIRLRCAHRVMFPLGALLPPWPAELVSSRLRSWGLPFEALLSLVVPYALSGAASLLELGQTPRCWPLLQGLSHHQGSRPELWGLARSLLRMPPWASAPPRFLAPRSGLTTRSGPNPHALLRPGHKDQTTGAPGLLLHGTQPLSFDSGTTPLGFFHLVGSLDSSFDSSRQPYR